MERVEFIIRRMPNMEGYVACSHASKLCVICVIRF